MDVVILLHTEPAFRHSPFGHIREIEFIDGLLLLVDDRLLFKDRLNDRIVVSHHKGHHIGLGIEGDGLLHREVDRVYHAQFCQHVALFRIDSQRDSLTLCSLLNVRDDAAMLGLTDADQELFGLHFGRRVDNLVDEHPDAVSIVQAEVVGALVQMNREDGLQPVVLPGFLDVDGLRLAIDDGLHLTGFRRLAVTYGNGIVASLIQRQLMAQRTVFAGT